MTSLSTHDTSITAQARLLTFYFSYFLDCQIKIEMEAF